MKTSRLFTALWATGMAVAVTACIGKEDVREVQKRMECTAEASYEVLAVNPSSITFDIASNTPWTIESDSDWCTPTPSGSAESSLSETILVRFADNETGSQREAVLTIRAEGVEDPVSIRFIQKVRGRIVLGTFSGAFPMEGGSATFTVLSNKDWTAVSSASWLTLSPAGGTASDQPVAVTATAAFAGGRKETARITVADTDREELQYFDVSIDGVDLAFADVEDADKELPFMGGKFVFPVSANVDYRVAVSPADAGLGVTKTEEGVELTVGQNTVFRSRGIVLTLSPVDDRFEGISTDLALEQEHMLAADRYEGVTIDENGAATFSGDGTKVQVGLKEAFKYGCFTWHFSRFDLDQGYFCSDNWWWVNPAPLSESTKNFMLMIRCGKETQLLASGGALLLGGKKVSFGSDNGWQNTLWNESKTFTPSVPDVTKVRKIRLLIYPGERTGTDQNRIIIKKLWVDDVLVVDWTANSGDIWQSGSPVPGIPFKFGVENAAGTLTIDAFEIDTDYQKYVDE